MAGYALTSVGVPVDLTSQVNPAGAAGERVSLARALMASPLPVGCRYAEFGSPGALPDFRRCLTRIPGNARCLLARHFWGMSEAGQITNGLHSEPQ